MRLIINLLVLLLNLYELILFARFIIEIVKIFSQRPFSEFMVTIYGLIFNITEPVILFIKNKIPTTFHRIDFSYLILILVLEVIKKILYLIF